MSPTVIEMDDCPFKVITGGVVSAGGVVVPELFPSPPPVEFVVPVLSPPPVDVALSFVEVEFVVEVVSEFITIIDPFTTVDVVADTKGCVLVCSK